jgi:nucleotide-binding universal stress UspA family protein
MYNKIMVPLDGSELAECVFPQVEAIATGCRVHTVVFIRAVEPIELRPFGEIQIVLDECKRKSMEAEIKAHAQQYLDQLVERLNFGASKLETKVIVGPAAASLADFAERNNVDLIVIATHGRSGISRWVWGSVADRILRAACVPVLMVRAPGCSKPGPAGLPDSEKI